MLSARVAVLISPRITSASFELTECVRACVLAWPPNRGQRVLETPNDRGQPRASEDTSMTSVF